MLIIVHMKNNFNQLEYSSYMQFFFFAIGLTDYSSFKNEQFDKKLIYNFDRCNKQKI